MSLNLKLAMPLAPTMPGAAKGKPQKAASDGGLFGSLVHGAKQDAEGRDGIARGEPARTELGWKTRKAAWVVRDAKADPAAADKPTDPSMENGDAPGDSTGILAIVGDGVPPSELVVRAEVRSAMGAGEPAAEQPRGRRTGEAAGKDDGPAGSRPSVPAMAAPDKAGGSGVENRIGATDAAAAPLSAQASPDADENGARTGRAIEPLSAVRENLPREHLDGKVTVVSTQVSVAPAAAPQLSPTGAALVMSLSSEGALPQYVSEMPNALPSQDARPVTMLKLQLHPAELGAVTVQLSGSGDQLAVELHVETTEARHRLASDSDAIVKALRGMGYDIDRITVQQAPSTTASNGGGTNRENAFTQQDGRSGERPDQQGRHGTEPRHEQDAQTLPATGGDRGASGGGVYI